MALLTLASALGGRRAFASEAPEAAPPRRLLGPEELCPKGKVPSDWLERCLQGNLLYGHVEPDPDFVPEVGNGFVATVVNSDTIYSAGFFNGDALNKCKPPPSMWCGAMSHRARIPAYRVSVAGALEDVQQALDVERAVFLSRGSTSGGAVVVDEAWYAPYDEPSLLVHEIRLNNTGSSSQVVKLKANASDSSDDLDVEAIDQKGVYGISGSNKVPEIAGTDRTRVAMVANKPPPSITLAANEQRTFYALTVVMTSLKSDDPESEALGTLQKYVGDGSFSAASGLREAHAAKWESRADGGRLEVEGDLSLAQALNASLYYIRTSVRDDWAYGISPGGLASNRYNGHTFWDQETWMYPPILVLEPELARSMLQYRFDRMDHAKEKAQACKPVPDAFLEEFTPFFQEHGGMKAEFWTKNKYKDSELAHPHCNKDYQDRVAPEALMFPWESATTGTETVYLDGKLGPWGMFEQHLNGDIAFAIRQYYYLTGDTDWLRDVGFPIVNGTASFYSARLEERPGEDGAWDFKTVMGPDEYAFPVVNSGYTNLVTQMTLEFAVEAAKELGYAGAAYSQFEAQAKGIHIPTADKVPGRPDLKGGYHPEYEGFPEGSPGKIYPPSPPCNASDGCVKQADAVLLSFPLGMEMEPQVLANDLTFYENVTDPNGPAMTWAMFAVGWFTVGDTARAAKMFPRGFANVHQPFLVWSEYPATFEDHGAVNFITGAGAFLNSVVFGTSGMRLEKYRLLFNPPPPSATGTGATRLVVHSLHFLGARLRQEVDEDSMRYELLEPGPDGASLCLKRSGHGEKELQVGKAVGCPRGKAEIRRCEAAESTERRLAFV